jgi:hypothetical protein
MTRGGRIPRIEDLNNTVRGPGRAGLVQQRQVCGSRVDPYQNLYAPVQILGKDRVQCVPDFRPENGGYDDCRIESVLQLSARIGIGPHETAHRPVTLSEQARRPGLLRNPVNNVLPRRRPELRVVLPSLSLPGGDDPQCSR